MIVLFSDYNHLLLLSHRLLPMYRSMIFKSLTCVDLSFCCFYYAPVICIPHLWGWTGIMIVNFQSPCINPALWGQADGNNSALCPALHNRKSHRGMYPNVITPALPRHCRNNQTVIALHLSQVFQRLSS